MTITVEAFTPVMHQRMPETQIDRDEWAIEQGLALLADSKDRRLLDYARVRLGWTEQAWDDELAGLVVLADEVYQAELCTQRGHLATATDAYRHRLTLLARGPVRPDDFTAAADQVLGIVADDQPRVPLAVVRGDG